MLHRPAPFLPHESPYSYSVVTTRQHQNIWREIYSRRLTYDDSLRRLRSLSTQTLVVRRRWLRPVGDRSFGAATPRIWNELPADVLSPLTHWPKIATFSHLACIQRPRYGGSRRNIAITFGTEELERWVYQTVKKVSEYLYSFRYNRRTAKAALYNSIWSLLQILCRMKHL